MIPDATHITDENDGTVTTRYVMMRYVALYGEPTSMRLRPSTADEIAKFKTEQHAFCVERDAREGAKKSRIAVAREQYEADHDYDV